MSHSDHMCVISYVNPCYWSPLAPLTLTVSVNLLLPPVQKMKSDGQSLQIIMWNG